MSSDGVQVPIVPKLIELIEKHASERPDAVFLEEVTGRKLTYGEVAHDGLRWAAALQRAGVQEGDTVASMLPSGIDAVLAWLGCAWVGALEVPLGGEHEGDGLEFVVHDSRCRVILVSERYLHRLVEIAPRLPADIAVVVVDGAPADAPPDAIGAEEFFASGAPAEGLAAPEVDATACVIYTSGSTGRPKGVIVPWGQLASQPSMYPIEQMTSADDRYVPFPMSHVGGRTSVYLQAVLGARAVLREQFSVDAFWDEVAAFGCTHTTLVASMAAALYRQPPKPSDADNPLRLVMMLPLIAEVEDFAARFGVEVMTSYGTTEIGWPLASATSVVDPRTCGRARPGYQLRLVNERDGEVPCGEPGELVVRTASPWTMMQGYFRRPGATVVAWRNLWFHTGDVFTRDEDGNYSFVDRMDDVIRCNGHFVSSSELERRVAELADVAACAAVAVPTAGDGDDILVVVEPVAGASPSPIELWEQIVPRLPAAMAPRYVEVVARMPRTETGKIRKGELRVKGPSEAWDSAESSADTAAASA